MGPCLNTGEEEKEKPKESSQVVPVGVGKQWVPLRGFCTHTEIPLEKTNVSFVRGHQLKIASKMGWGLGAHFPS